MKRAEPKSTLNRIDVVDTERHWRRFRTFWLLGFFFLVVNFSVLLHLGNLNAVEKFLLLLAGASYLRSKPFDRVSLALVGGIVAVTFTCALATRFPLFSWGRYASAVIALLSLLSFLCAWPTERERALMLKTLAWVPLAIVLLGGVYELADIYHITVNDHVGARRLQGTTVPAFLAAAGFAGSVAAAFLTTVFDRRYIALTAINLVIIFLTASRMPSAAAMAAVVVILLSGLRSGVWRLGFMVYGFAAVVGFAVAFGDQLLKRFSSESTSGREQLWGVLEGWLARYPWTGVGFGHHGLLVPDQVARYLGTVAAHNEYLRVSVELGYIGAVAFLLLLLGLLLRIAIDPRNSNRLAFVSVVALYLANSYTDNTLYATYSFMILVAGFMGIANAQPVARRDPSYHPKAMRGTTGPAAMRRDFNQPGLVHAIKRPLTQRALVRDLQRGVNKP